MFNNDFYPTPSSVAAKMIDRMFQELEGVEKPTILEPSAGKGDLLDQLKDYRCKVFAIESDPELQATLTGKGYSVVAHDFLSYTPSYRFDAIIMNPPFSAGADHLLHAWDIMSAGVIICLLNTATILNPSSNKRELLQNIISEHGETVNLGQCFQDAERKTAVDVTMVILRKKENGERFSFFESVDKEKSYSFDGDQMPNEIAVRDVIGNLVTEYEKIKELFVEYFKIRSKMAYHASHVLSSSYEFDKYLFESIRSLEGTPTLDTFNQSYNAFVDRFKHDCWENVFRMSKFENFMTRKVRSDFHSFQKDQQALDFTKENIEQLFLSLLANGKNISQACIEEVFDLFTKYHAENRVHVEGWKTDKAWMAARKVILPYIVERWSAGSWHTCYSHYDDTRDIDIAMCAISGRKMEHITTILQALEYKFCVLRSNPASPTECESTFFDIRFYKKGTVHLTFKDEWLWKEFNKRACKMKGWLPDYGTAASREAEPTNGSMAA